MRLEHIISEDGANWQWIADMIANRLPGEPETSFPSNMLLKKIGEGGSRFVYRIYGHKAVAKIDIDAIRSRAFMRSWANKSEWNAYHSASPGERRRLARPLALSKDTSVLIMTYLPEPAKPEDVAVMKKAAPALFTDPNARNIRRTRTGKPKIIDYQEW